MPSRILYPLHGENNTRFAAGNEFSASATLNDFLRQKRVSMGTKVMCKQGGCGICIVEAKMLLGSSPNKVSAAVNSVSIPIISGSRAHVSYDFYVSDYARSNFQMLFLNHYFLNHYKVASRPDNKHCFSPHHELCT